VCLEGRAVLDPLGMTGSLFPERWPAADERAVGCHYLDTDGAFVQVPAKVATVPTFLGLWTTADNLVRFALGWSSLLPAPLAEEAMRPLARPHASSPGGIGLGWQANESRGVAAASGVTHGAGWRASAGRKPADRFSPVAAACGRPHG
jgi:CubicO group peptidase (beta-lactamase class C family)